METRDLLAQYYANYDEDGRLGSRHGAVEFLTTMRFVEKYLEPGARIIEIGAGTGRYSHTLAERGYSVDAVELLEHNIEIFKSHITEGEPVTVRQGNALHLDTFTDNTYDITLLLGPMYHLFTEEEQRTALLEAVRVTKHGGVIMAAYCMGDASLLSYGFAGGHAKEIVEKCGLDPVTFKTFLRPWDLFELYRKEDIERLRGDLPVEALHFVATDGFANYMREALGQMDEETYRLFLCYHFATCERSDMIGMSHHTLDIMRKR